MTNCLYHNENYYTNCYNLKDDAVLTAYRDAVGLSLHIHVIDKSLISKGHVPRYRMFSTDFDLIYNSEIATDITVQQPYLFYLLQDVTEADLIIFELLGYTLFRMADDAHITEKIEIEGIGYNHYYYNNISYMDIRSMIDRRSK